MKVCGLTINLQRQDRPEFLREKQNKPKNESADMFHHFERVYSSDGACGVKYG